MVVYVVHVSEILCGGLRFSCLSVDVSGLFGGDLRFSYFRDIRW